MWIFICMFLLERHNFSLQAFKWCEYLLIKATEGREGVMKFRPPRNAVGRNMGISYARSGRVQSQHVSVWEVFHSGETLDHNVLGTECGLQFKICSGLFSTPLFSIAVLHPFSNYPFILSNPFFKKEYWPFTSEILHRSLILGLRLLMCEISLLRKKGMLTMKWERIHFKTFHILRLFHLDLKLKNMPT